MNKEYIKLGFYLGVNGVITFKNCKLIEVYKEIGIQNIMLETDSPYLTPVPFRGKQNYPGNIKYVAKFISENLNISMDELAEITNSNVKKLFNISIWLAMIIYFFFILSVLYAIILCIRG